nr:ISAs1 family transposase [Pseudoalteromonas sp. NBT06-2]
MLDIEGTTITTNAMGCQFAIGNQIIAAKTDYVLVLRGNQGKFHDDIKLFLDTQLKSCFTSLAHMMFKSVDGEHGRIEQRTVWLTTNIDWLIESHSRWISVKAITVVDSTRQEKVNMKPKKNDITSAVMKIKQLNS